MTIQCGNDRQMSYLWTDDKKPEGSPKDKSQDSLNWLHQEPSLWCRHRDISGLHSPRVPAAEAELSPEDEGEKRFGQGEEREILTEERYIRRETKNNKQ